MDNYNNPQFGVAIDGAASEAPADKKRERGSNATIGDENKKVLIKE